MLRKTGEALGIEMYNQPKVFPSTLKGEKQDDVAERLFKVILFTMFSEWLIAVCNRDLSIAKKVTGYAR